MIDIHISMAQPELPSGASTGIWLALPVQFYLPTKYSFDLVLLMNLSKVNGLNQFNAV